MLHKATYVVLWMFGNMLHTRGVHPGAIIYGLGPMFPLSLFEAILTGYMNSENAYGQNFTEWK